jgi:aromatic-amino-acid transaminase
MRSTPVSAPPPPSPLATAARDREAGDVIFRMHGAARRRRAEGADVIDSTLGVLVGDDGTLAILPTVAEVVRELPGEASAGYPPLTGRPDLIEAIERDLLPPGPLRDQAVSVITPGGTGAIYQAIVNILDPGEAALTTDLTWGPYLSIARQAGRRVERFAMFDDAGGFDPGAMAEALHRLAGSQGRILLLLNSPCQNPTGYALTREDWAAVADAVAEVAARVPVAVLLDVAYLRYSLEDEGWWDAVERILQHGTVLFAWSASKAFTQYGARVGALVGLHRSPEVRDEMARAFNFAARGTWSACNHGGQVAIERLLSEPDLAERTDRERETLRVLLSERWSAFSEAATAAGLRTPSWSGGFFTCLRTGSAPSVAERLMARDVFVVPVPGAVRVAICATPAVRMRELVGAVAAEM